ncbi:hypothetical protein GGR90_000267 [Sphingopyxis italica]|uniref:Uncharacterized protein n=1 Tax=Sphingopyxis italica TaxID=1129133 RepID=A0A7X6B6Z6_9SPHN|nr:hypothetical protein [Sphingopyxis italica]NJB88115.1 hypothetical protein [Sphingopyxis italica]
MLLFLLSIGYAGQFILRHWPADATELAIGGGTLAAAAALYALTQVSSAIAWIAGLRAMGYAMPLALGLRINLVAQIGKYLPGNVAHFLGRAGLAASAGIRFAGSGLATLVEILATLIAATAVTVMALSLDPAPIAVISGALADNGLLQLAAGGGATLAIAVVLSWMKVPARAFFAASLCLAASFLLTGLSFHFLVAALAPVPLSPAATIGIFAVAWAVGYVIPGAPAGLGVREAVLMAWLGPLVGAGTAIACVLLHRILTAVVDGLAALAGFIWFQIGTR